MKKLFFAASLLLGSFLIAPAAESTALSPLEFLVGSWSGDGKAEGNSGKGTTTFTWELSRQVLVRRDHTDYAAAAGRPASTYEALMVFYKDPASGQIAANYFDNGNHVIHYRISPSTQPKTLQFLSDSPGPACRLTYT